MHRKQDKYTKDHEKHSKYNKLLCRGVNVENLNNISDTLNVNMEDLKAEISAFKTE